MNAIAFALRELRRDTAFARSARAAAKRMLSLSVRPTALHSLLLGVQQMGSLAVDELSRALYWQPLFELQCEEVGEGCRLIVAPDSKLPALSGCKLVLGPRVTVFARATISGAREGRMPTIRIGEGTVLGDRVILRAGLGIEIGRHCLIGNGVTLAGDPGHPMDPIARRTMPAPLSELGRIAIGDDVWVAEGSIVLANVTIGDGAVVGARSVVTKDVPAWTVVAGSPARVMRELPRGSAWPPRANAA